MPGEERAQIGEVAEHLGLSQRTIRYYEEIGLVRPARSSGGFWLYGPQDVARLRLLKQMKPLEFTLTEMGELLDVMDRLAQAQAVPDAEATALDRRLRTFEEQTRQRVAELDARARTGRDLIDQLRAARAGRTNPRPPHSPGGPSRSGGPSRPRTGDG